MDTMRMDAKLIILKKGVLQGEIRCIRWIPLGAELRTFLIHSSLAP
jgi:hypothetical protein